MFLKQDLFSVHGSCQTLACVAGYSSCGETCFMREHSLNTCSVQAPEKCRFCRLESGQAENVTSIVQDVRHSRRYVIHSIPYFSPKNPRNGFGSILATSCQVRVLQRNLKSTGETHRITAYHASIRSDLLASMSRQNEQ